jgi:uncharacterized membrane protein YoaK (UPF0700 family)
MDDSPQQRILTLIAIALTFASGATDVASYTRLGNVFTSVMTGNIVLLGLAVARHSLTLASHTLVSIAGYITGVAGGTWIAHGFRVAGAAADPGAAGSGAAGSGAAGSGAAGSGSAGAAAKGGAWVIGGAAADEGRASGLPGHVGWALLAELILLCGLTVGWEIDGASPAGWAQFCLLAVAATAMGVQSSTVKYMGLSEVSTTYLTGTLTGLVSSMVSPKQATQYRARRFGVLIGLATGAALSGLLIATAADAAPALPLAALATCLLLASAPRRWWDSRLVAQRADAAQRPDAAQPGRPTTDEQRAREPERDAAPADGPLPDGQRPAEAPADRQRPGEAPADVRRPGELEPGGR